MLSRAPRHRSSAHVPAPQPARACSSTASHLKKKTLEGEAFSIKVHEAVSVHSMFGGVLDVDISGCGSMAEAKTDSKMKGAPRNHAKQMLRSHDSMSCASWFFRDAVFRKQGNASVRCDGTCSKKTEQFNCSNYLH